MEHPDDKLHNLDIELIKLETELKVWERAITMLENHSLLIPEKIEELKKKIEEEENK